MIGRFSIKSPYGGILSAAISAILSFVVFLCAIFTPLSVFAYELIIVEVNLNTVRKPDLFVFFQDDGDFLLRAADLDAMGVQRVAGQEVIVDNESYLSLRSLQGVEFVFEEETLSLAMTVDPELLPVSVVDMMPRQKQQVYYPREDSVIFNYGLDYETGTGAGNGFELQNFNISNELGIRNKDILFFTDTFYHEDEDERSFVRLNTHLTYDQRDRMRRFVAGDSAAFSGELGSRINFAGLSMSKTFQLDPYFLENPFFNYSGLLSLPSELAIYSNGIKLSREELPPGRFDLQNFHNTGGAQDIVLEITDSLGRIQRFSSIFYFSNLLLREGVSEYSYNLGTLRRDYGLEGNHYSHAIFSARHRYGFTDEFNLGFRSEAGNEIYNLGLESLYSIRNYGVLGFDISGSGGDGSGWASLFRYEFRNHKYSFRFAWKSFSTDYQNFERQEAANRKKSDVRLGIGYVERKLGSIALDIARTEYQEVADEDLVALSYSRQLSRKWNLNSTLRYWDTGEKNTEIYLSLNYYFDKDHTLSSRIRKDDNTNQQSFEARRDIPVGEGWGWWSQFERGDNGIGETYTFNPGGQWNTPYGIYRGEFNLNSENENIRVAASGAVVSIAGEYSLTRPVTDSFGLVKVNELEDVRIYVNGQETGRTDKQGQLFIPDLTSFYHNRVSIEDEDISIDYLMPKIETNISPPFRSGSCIVFPVERYQAFTGVLLGSIGGVQKPLEFYEGEFFGAMRTIKFFTGSGGEFYFDNDPGSIDESLSDPASKGCAALNAISADVFRPGIYGGQAISDIGDICRFELKIPETDERYFELGETTCTPEVDNEIQLELDSNSEKIEDGDSAQP